MTDILKRDWVWERHKWTLENFTSGFPSSNKGVVIVPPSSLGGSSEPQKLLHQITSILPDLLSPDKKTILTSKLQSYKKALTEYPELVKRSKVLQVWERNQTKLTTFITEVKEATEEQLAKETDKSKKKDCQTTITKLTNLLNEISGLNLGKEELKEIISERIDDYDWGEAENKINTKIGKDWKDAIDESTADNFNTLKSNLLKMLAEIILDYYLTNTSKKPKERLEIIDNYLTEATEAEVQTVIKETTRAEALTRLREKCKDLKGTITVDMKDSLEIIDEKNTSGNRALAFEISKKLTTFDDFTAIGKLAGINDTNKVVIYYNFDGDSSNQDKKFKELKNHLNGYQNRKLVFHFDKLEEGDHKLVRISGKEIHLDYDSYTKVEVSGGVKLADTDERWKNIHADFETNPHMIKNWTDLSFTFDQVRDWINIGILPDEQMLVSWLIAVKKGRHNEPEWVLNNADMTKLRREWLEYEIDKRLKKYKTKSWDAEAEFERFAGKDGKGHWGSVERGKSWREYVKKIKEVDESDDLSYKSARGNVLYGLAEFLIPEFISRWTQKTSGKRNMKKAEILDYINQNCSTNENSYYNNVDGSIKYSFWNKKNNVRVNVESLVD